MLNKLNSSFIIISLNLNIASISINIILILFTVLAFLVKFPIYGVHQWLPKAHVEAPVRGSMVLAGILLKLGGYGLIRLGPLFININPLFVFILLSLLGGGFLAIVCCGVSDLKVIIAYSSVVHIAFIIVGIISIII